MMLLLEAMQPRGPEKAFRDGSFGGGAIANENHMVGHYWLRYPDLLP